MPANTGHRPTADTVDLRFRGGTTARSVDPKRYRWTRDDSAYPPDYAFDIVTWRAA